MSKRACNAVIAAIELFGTEQKLADAAGVSQPAINKAKHNGRLGAKLAYSINKATGNKIKLADLLATVEEEWSK